MGQKLSLHILLCISCWIFAGPLHAQTIQTFNFTGAAQNFVVPPGVTSIFIEAWGAQGGQGDNPDNVNLGGYAEGQLAVTPGETLVIYVGGQGMGTAGGFNGGGAGEFLGTGGGGASDVRRSGGTLNDRLIVAGGGGGGGVLWFGAPVIGGIGGGLVGGDGSRDGVNPGGDGGTQTASGNGTCGSFNNPVVSGGFGFGGSPAGLGCGCDGYGGGGGWYGGAGSGNCRGGGGGSSYIAGAGLTKARIVRSKAATTGGSQIGNGLVRFTFTAGAIAPTGVPVAGPLGLGLMSLLLGIAGTVVSRRRRTI